MIYLEVKGLHLRLNDALVNVVAVVFIYIT